jgi:putative phosphoribosyl transferase
MKDPHLKSICIDIGAGEQLKGFFDCPDDAHALVVFVHGSGSSRFSQRNNCVARFLRDQGFATLLMDLLTTCEDQQDAITRELRFNIPLLAERVSLTLDWLAKREEVTDLPIGLFGASTGAAAALVAAAAHPMRVGAVVSRGGRPDLAGNALISVRAPTLLIVGGADTEVLGLNRLAMRRMAAPTELVVIEGATHLFEEPGALDQVSERAAAWFREQLTPSTPSQDPPVTKSKHAASVRLSTK